ncbi:hypothetical protein [Acidovorax sp. FG27]|uniref:hypothetical protein n=1 Tax=Acidovorax sp. FG27 TaxID=3133652 RepID=UPI0033428009
MSKTYRQHPDKPKPRELKRRRQREAMVMRSGAHTAVLLPDPEPPIWKPLG